ncbi:MAG TPA: tetratricopeptide repeat protein [Rhodobacteraceae bacterium]|jgi:Flp pilus assembly protein TadD|nr:tetratricopeptide repeat protein [Paracoccaceae bacterium]
MIQKTVGIILVFALLAACQKTGGFQRPADSPYAPTGQPRGGKSVDGLIVGHRLMAAAEYELALKAYYRAAGKLGLNADIYSALGSANLKLGRLGQAEKLLRKAIKIDAKFVPAWNNLGVVLMEKGQTAEAKRVFETAYALDSGESDSIRENLRIAIEKSDNLGYIDGDIDHDFQLMRRGNSEYLLLSTV